MEHADDVQLCKGLLDNELALKRLEIQFYKTRV